MITYTLLSGGVSPFWGGNRYRTMAKVLSYFPIFFILSILSTYIPMYMYTFVYVYLCTCVPLYLCTFVTMNQFYLRTCVPLYLCTFVHICTFSSLYLIISKTSKLNSSLHARPCPATTRSTFQTLSMSPRLAKTSSRSFWCLNPQKGRQLLRPYNIRGSLITG